VHAEHPVIGEFEMPGAPFAMSGTPWRYRRRAPLLGEHNTEVFGEIGVSGRELQDLKAEGVL
jgi:crotonobetainyl-CoA:carnitine CoA-transferase CaiB-like acyl-CoA transferase